MVQCLFILLIFLTICSRDSLERRVVRRAALILADDAVRPPAGNPDAWWGEETERRGSNVPDGATRLCPTNMFLEE